MRKGYDVRELIETIGSIIDSEVSMNVAIIGIGNLGRAVAGYFKGKRSKLNLVASFDNDPQKVNKVISGVKCYPLSEMESVIKELDITDSNYDRPYRILQRRLPTKLSATE